MATNGPVRCGADAWWMARAICSLPVPVSPRMSTVEFVSATLPISSNTSCIRGDLESTFWNECRPWSWSRSAATSSCSARSRSARVTRNVSWSGS